MRADLVARPADRASLAAWLADHGTLIDAAAARPGAEVLRGRGRVLVVPAPGGGPARWVVRHYHRGGAAARLLGDRYLRLGAGRPLGEFRVVRALETLGIPTAPAVGAAVYPSGPFYRGDLVTEWVPDSEDLARLLFGARQLDEIARARPRGTGPGPAGVTADAGMESAGRLVRRLHEHGVSHPDLNLKNILVTTAGDAPRALILDLDRARLRGRLGERARRRMLRRFERSLRKWEDRAGTPLPPSLRAAFRRGYDALPEPSPGPRPGTREPPPR